MGLTAASEEFLELTKSALLAALEGIVLIKLYISFLHKVEELLNIALIFLIFFLLQLFLLVHFLGLLPPTFSHKLGLYDVQGPIPVVKNVFIPPDAEGGTLTFELEDVMPLLQFLAPVC